MGVRSTIEQPPQVRSSTVADTQTAGETVPTAQGFEVGSEMAWSMLDSSAGNVEFDVTQAIQDREPLDELRDLYVSQVVISAPDRASDYMEPLEAYDLDMGGESALDDFKAGAERGARSVITVKRLREIARNAN